LRDCFVGLTHILSVINRLIIDVHVLDFEINFQKAFILASFSCLLCIFQINYGFAHVFFLFLEDLLPFFSLSMHFNHILVANEASFKVDIFDFVYLFPSFQLPFLSYGIQFQVEHTYLFLISFFLRFFFFLQIIPSFIVLLMPVNLRVLQFFPEVLQNFVAILIFIAYGSVSH
jgi:hypothetical protein